MSRIVVEMVLNLDIIITGNALTGEDILSTHVDSV